MYRLLIEDDEGRTTIVPLIRNVINIGREEGNTIRLTERNVSRRHARLAIKDGQIFIEDLQSYNGVWVNGTRADGNQAIKPGDLLEIGDYHLSIQEEASEVERKARPSLPPEQDFDDQTPPLGLPPLKPSGGSAETSSKPSRLLVLNTSYSGREFLLNKNEITIGRTEDNDICIDHASVSRQHAKISQQGDAYQLTDLGSANGIQVNGEEYNTCDLRWGDIIELGQVRLRFVSPNEVTEGIREPAESSSTSSRSQASSERKSSFPFILGFVVLLVALGVGAWFLMSPSGLPPEKRGVTAGNRVLPPSNQEDINSPQGQEKIFKRAEDSFAQEEYDEALKLLNNLLSVRKDWKKALELKKRALYEKEQLQKLLRAKEMRVEGDYKGAYNLLDEVQKDSRYHARAQGRRKEYEPLLLRDFMEKANRAMSLKRYNEALQFTDDVLRVKKDHPDALAMHKSLKSLLNKDLNLTINRDTPPSPDRNDPPRRKRPRRKNRKKRPLPRKTTMIKGQRELCNQFYKQKKFAKALNCFKAWTDTHPKDADAFAFMGTIASSLGRCGQPTGREMMFCVLAEGHYRTYLRLKPNGALAPSIRRALQGGAPPKR